MIKERTLTIVVLIALLISSIPFIINDAEAGEPIFMANSLVNWEEELRTYKQRPSDIVSTQDGRIYVSFYSGMTTTDYLPWTSYVAYSEDSGSTWSRSFRVDDVLRDGNQSNDATAQATPRLAEAPNGTLFCVWADNRDFTHTQQIRMSWTTDGENFSRSVRIDPEKRYPNYDAQNPNIEINDNGRIVVAWEDRNESGSYLNVYSSYSDDGGKTWSEMIRVNTDNMHSRSHEHTRMAMHGDDVYITWHDNRGDGQYRPYLAISHNSGRSFLPEIALSDDLEMYNSRQWPSPVVDDVGNLYVTWRDKRSGFDEIWFVRSTDGGATFSNNKKVTSVPEGSEDWFPSTAAMEDGIVSVAFQRRVPTHESKDEGEILFINSTDGGMTWNKLMRVDDTDMRWDDLSTQEKPVMIYDISGRVIVAWTDSRDSKSNNYYSDVWFSRHSGDLSGPNHPPQLYDIQFLGDFSFNPEVGSALSPFLFSCNYSDEDNDEPLDGYPRLHVFNDSAGNDPLFNEPVVLEKAVIRDVDYINGALYSSSIPLNSTGGQLYYRIEVIEERDPNPILSPIIPGPVIDANPPRITINEPENMSWMTTNQVRCSILVEEMEGAHVDIYSIKIRKSTSGPDRLDKGIRITNLEKIDNNTYKGYIDIRLENGKDNFIQFEAKDRVRNLGTSELVNVWIDAFAPYYTRIGPRGTQLYESVNCTIDWMDRYPGSTLPNTGINVSSIMYSYKTTSGSYSDWLIPDGSIEISNGTYRSWVDLDFENEGIYNYIRWKASDNIGNVRFTHDDPDHPNGGVELKIFVEIPDNYPPSFHGKAYPSVVASSTPHFYWDDAFDEENDLLFYRVMIMKNDLQWTNWIDIGERTFYDVSNDVTLDPDWYILRINVTDNIGGYDLFDHPFKIIDQGTPPPDDIPRASNMYTSSSDFTIEWDDSPSWAFMNITYWIRIGTRDWKGDVLDWTPIGSDPMFSIEDLDLEVGLYSVQYMAENNGNFSRVSQSKLKVNDYNIEVIGPEDTFRSYRGKGEGIRIELYNWASFTDNVTLKLTGEIADKGWAYILVDKVRTEPDGELTVPEPNVIMITIFPPREAKTGTYHLALTVTSEDDKTITVIDNITVKIVEKQNEGIGGEITDTLYGLMTDVLPFLKPLSPNLISGLFFLIVLIIVMTIAIIGILIYKTSKRSKEDDDPYSEQRRLYKELYGDEPTIEQLKEMKEGSIVDEVMGDLHANEEEKSKFDESFLDSETHKSETEE